MSVCVCMREREREKERVGVCDVKISTRKNMRSAETDPFEESKNALVDIFKNMEGREGKRWNGAFPERNPSQQKV